MEWLAPGQRVPPLPHQDQHQTSLAQSVRAGLLRAGANFGGENREAGPTDLTTKVRTSLQTFNQKWTSSSTGADSDDEVSIVTLNTDTTDTSNTEDFDDFSDFQSELDTWLAK